MEEQSIDPCSLRGCLIFREIISPFSLRFSSVDLSHAVHFFQPLFAHSAAPSVERVPRRGRSNVKPPQESEGEAPPKNIKGTGTRDFNRLKGLWFDRSCFKESQADTHNF